jgi:hypothetical protein
MVRLSFPAYDTAIPAHSLPVMGGAEVMPFTIFIRNPSSGKQKHRYISLYSLLHITSVGGMPCEKERSPARYLSSSPRIVSCRPCICGNCPLSFLLLLPAAGRGSEDQLPRHLWRKATDLCGRRENSEVLLRETESSDNRYAAADRHRYAHGEDDNNDSGLQHIVPDDVMRRDPYQRDGG